MTPAEEALKAKREAEDLLRLTELYPDLKKSVNRWGTVRYYSPTVNTLATDYEARHTCGCCSDAPLQVWPYFQTEFGRVYSDPPSFTIGERDPDIYEDHAYPGWADQLRKAGILDMLIERMACLFKSEEEPEEEPIDESSSA